jgi:RimJ/RimL family protein N-acetyltransferase
MFEKLAETHRVLLRKIDRDDKKDFVNLATNPDFARYSPLKEVTVADATFYFETIMDSLEDKTAINQQYWTVVDKISKNFVGFTGFYPIKFENKDLNMFIIALQHKCWAPFFSSQAAYLSCNQAFKDNSFTSLIAFIHPEDKGGVSFAELIGGKKLDDTTVFGFPVSKWEISKDSLIDPLAP